MRPPAVQDLGGVWLLDSRHGGRTGTIGVFLVPLAEGRFALVETGPSSTLAQIEAAMYRLGYRWEDLEAVLLTHIHLDHAGAVGAVAAKSSAWVAVQARGAPHLADPSRLLRGAGRIYGPELDRLWGPMLPVPEARIVALEGGETLQLGLLRVRVLYAPGHASHHVCYLLEDGSLFTGDAAGIRLPGAVTIRPALAPPEIDLERWEATIADLRAARPSRLLLTHFGLVEQPDEHLAALPGRNRRWAEEILSGLRSGESDEALEARTVALELRELATEGASPELIDRYQITSDAAMTVQGVRRYWQKHHPELLPGD